MLRVLLIAGLLAAPVGAQLTGLSTTSDGSIVYFSTPLRQTGTNQPLWSKLFAADEHGIRLALQRDTIRWTENLNRTSTSNPYRLSEPVISEDGSVLAFTSSSVCGGGGSGCIGRSSRYAEVRAGVTTSSLGPGAASLSRNGRFVLRAAGAFEEGGAALYDRMSGETVSLMRQPRSGRHVMTDDGAILANSLGGWELLLWHPFTTRRPAVIGELASIGEAQVDASGSMVVFSSGGLDNWNIEAVEVASGKRMCLASGRPPPFDSSLSSQALYPRVRFSLSSDGSLVLFTALVDRAMQLFLARTDGSSIRALPQVQDGISDAVLSGTGRIVYASTTTSGLLRIDVETGELKWLNARTAIMQLPLRLSRGSYVRTTGLGFLEEGRSETAVAPLPRSLGGIQLIVGGVPAPIAHVTSSELAWQAPWEANSGALELKQQGARFEQGPIQNVCCEPHPQFLIATAVHEAFDSLVTPEKPARAGEVVHFYMTGLGEVSLPVATGEISPADPPAKVLESLTVLVNNTPAEVLFAGLAPGLVGIYQVDVRLPRDLVVSDVPVLMYLTSPYPYASTRLPVRP